MNLLRWLGNKLKLAFMQILQREYRRDKGMPWVLEVNHLGGPGTPSGQCGEWIGLRHALRSISLLEIYCLLGKAMLCKHVRAGRHPQVTSSLSTIEMYCLAVHTFGLSLAAFYCVRTLVFISVHGKVRLLHSNLVQWRLKHGSHCSSWLPSQMDG